MKPAAVIGWTQEGSAGDFQRSVRSKLPRGRLERYGGTVVAGNVDPVVAASRVSRLPGAAWAAVGFEFAGLDACLENLAFLARRYLRTGGTFRVLVDANQSDSGEGDVVLAANSRILGAVKGSRVRDQDPKVTFRVSMRGSHGACGVELRKGPGGIPTGPKRAICLASGGRHSSVMSWMAALSGFSVTLVHSWVDDSAMMQVARLYSELSHRMDASKLELLVLRGQGGSGGRLESWLRSAERPVFCGAHPACVGDRAIALAERLGGTMLPLFLLKEEQVVGTLASLGLKDAPSARLGTKWDRPLSTPASRRFGGVEADMNAVLDSVLR